MLAGLKQAVSGPNEPPRSDRAIADSWRGLYGSDPFSVNAAVAPFRGPLKRHNSGEYIDSCGVFSAGMAMRDPACYGLGRILDRAIAKPGKVGSVWRWPGTGRHDQTVS